MNVQARVHATQQLVKLNLKTAANCMLKSPIKFDPSSIAVCGSQTLVQPQCTRECVAISGSMANIWITVLSRIVLCWLAIRTSALFDRAKINEIQILWCNFGNLVSGGDSRTNGGGCSWEIFKRTPNGYQDPLLCAQLENCFISKRCQQRSAQSLKIERESVNSSRDSVNISVF